MGQNERLIPPIQTWNNNDEDKAALILASVVRDPSQRGNDQCSIFCIVIVVVGALPAVRL